MMGSYYSSNASDSNSGPTIVRSYAGDGTADTVYVWSDGVTENVRGHCGISPRERYLRDRNTVTDPWNPYANSIQISTVVEPVIEEKPRPVKHRPWTLVQGKPKTPFFVARPEFHARSNPQRR